MSPEINWERQAKNSKRSAMMTILGVALVIAALAYSAYSLSTLQTEKQVLEDEIAKRENRLHQLEGAEMELQSNLARLENQLVLKQQELNDLGIIIKEARADARDTATRDKLEVAWQYSQLATADLDFEVDNESLLQQYQTFKDQHVGTFSEVGGTSLDAKIEELSSSIKEFETLEEELDADTLTVTEKIMNAKRYSGTRLSKKESRVLESRVSKLTKTAEEFATIIGENNLVTCADVVDQMPRGISDQFTPGTVWVWARVNAPQEEELTFKWLGWNGEPIGDPITVRVRPNTTGGYRTSVSREFDESELGRYEIRVHNSQGDLIGRRWCKLVSAPVAGGN